MNSRRDFLKQASIAAAGAGLLHTFPEAIQRAFAIDPMPGSSYLDAEHIVFLMQENRSFDHTYGALKGVRGFNDPRFIRLGNGRPVWMQSDKAGRTYAPFRLNLKDTKSTWMSSLPHAWTDQVDACNNGLHDRWLDAKKSWHKEYAAMPLTMGYYTREDIPFYYALADAFTVCDQNFCSSLTGTTPNRLYFWSGTARDPADPKHMAKVWNGDADYSHPVSWKTYPERLEEENISWKVYQNEISAGMGLTPEEDSWLGNFTDNPLEFFSQYNVKLSPGYIANLPNAEKNLVAEIEKTRLALANAPKAKVKELEASLQWLQESLAANREEQKVYTLDRYNALDEKAKLLHHKAFVTNKSDPDYHSLEEINYKDGNITRTVNVPKGDVLHEFRHDVDNGKLPTVSWLVAPENFSDHPGAAWYGAWYLSEVFNILTKNPAVWAKTIFVLTYDENDGYFDHVPPFLPPVQGKGKCSDGIDPGVEFVRHDQQTSEQKDSRESAIGLGFRVPMVVASPWSRGGYVNSQVFDHTSALQFLEHFLSHKKGKTITESNISAWRRAVTGNMTSVFRLPENAVEKPAPVDKKSFIAAIHSAQFKRLPSGFRNLKSSSVAGSAEIERVFRLQEKGTKPACALPYELYADMQRVDNNLSIRMGADNKFFQNHAAGAPFTIRFRDKNGRQQVRSYAVAAGTSVKDDWLTNDFKSNGYDLELHGPNGFFRKFTGKNIDPKVTVACNHKVEEGKAVVQLKLNNSSSLEKVIVIKDQSYGGTPVQLKIAAAREDVLIELPLEKSFGWYHFTVSIKGNKHFKAEYAGRVETGLATRTDPAMGAEVIST